MTRHALGWIGLASGQMVRGVEVGEAEGLGLTTLQGTQAVGVVGVMPGSHQILCRPPNPCTVWCPQMRLG